MAGGKEIRTKISSIKNTQKITKRDGNGLRRARCAKPRTICSWVSPMRTACARLSVTYCQRQARVQSRIAGHARSQACWLHRGFYRPRTLRRLEHQRCSRPPWQVTMKEFAERTGVDSRSTIGGRQPRQLAFFNSYGGNVVASVRDMGEEPGELTDVIGSSARVAGRFDEGEIDR